MLTETLEKLLTFQDLSQVESHLAIDAILGDANAHETASFLTLLRAKGESVAELKGIIAAMRGHMIPVSFPYPVLDIVGTGGDRAQTVNISTGGAILAASCGVKIAKHGNRNVSSQSGSADLLEALGVDIHQAPDHGLGISFLFAPNYHPAMHKIKEVRKGMKIRTVFNIIGPLLNPSSPDYLMVGVADPLLLEKMAQLLADQNVKRALVFHGFGTDELTTMGPAQILEVSSQGIHPFDLDPQSLGFSRCSIEDLRGGDAKHNARLLLDVFEGKQGAIADTLVLNAAVAAFLYGITPNIPEAVCLVRETIRNNRPIQLLNQWRQS